MSYRFVDEHVDPQFELFQEIVRSTKIHRQRREVLDRLRANPAADSLLAPLPVSEDSSEPFGLPPVVMKNGGAKDCFDGYLNHAELLGLIRHFRAKLDKEHDEGTCTFSSTRLLAP